MHYNAKLRNFFETIAIVCSADGHLLSTGSCKNSVLLLKYIFWGLLIVFCVVCGLLFSESQLSARQGYLFAKSNDFGGNATHAEE